MDEDPRVPFIFVCNGTSALAHRFQTSQLSRGFLLTPMEKAAAADKAEFPVERFPGAALQSTELTLH